MQEFAKYPPFFDSRSLSIRIRSDFLLFLIVAQTMTLISLLLLTVQTLSLSNCWLAERQTYSSFFPDPRLIEHLLEKMTLSQSSRVQERCSLHYLQRIQALASIRSRRFLAIHFLILQGFKIRRKVSCKQSKGSSLLSCLYVHLGLLSAQRIRIRFCRFESIGGRLVRGLDLLLVRTASSIRVSLTVDYRTFNSRATLAFDFRCLNDSQIRPRRSGVRS